MQSTAEKLARKNQEGLSLLLKLLAQLGMSYKEIAEVLGVSPSLITYWVQSKRRMSVEDQTWCYGTFVDAIMKRWPEENEAKQRRLLPLMKQLVSTWDEATELDKAQAEAELNARLDECSLILKHQVRSSEEWYRLETAPGDAQALVQALRENDLTWEAWQTAKEVIARVERMLGPDPTPARSQPTRSRRPRSLRRSRQRNSRRRAHA